MANLGERYKNSGVELGVQKNTSNSFKEGDRKAKRIAGGAIDGLDPVGDYIEEVVKRQRAFDQRLADNPRLRRRIGF